MGDKVQYTITCMECDATECIEAHLYTEAKAIARERGWGFRGVKPIYTHENPGKRRQFGELGTVLCPVHEAELVERLEAEAAARAKDAEAAYLIAMAERPAKFRELAEHLRGAKYLVEELDVFIPGIDFEWLADYAESLATRERSLSN